MPHLNHTGRIAASPAAAAGIGALAGTAVAGAAARPAVPAGTEHIQIVSATAHGPVTAIAYGAFTAAGSAHIGSGKVGTLHLNGGVIRLSHTAGKGTARFNPTTCLTLVRQPGTFTVTGGTGRFKGLARNCSC